MKIVSTVLFRHGRGLGFIEFEVLLNKEDYYSLKYFTSEANRNITFTIPRDGKKNYDEGKFQVIDPNAGSKMTFIFNLNPESLTYIDDENVWTTSSIKLEYTGADDISPQAVYDEIVKNITVCMNEARKRIASGEDYIRILESDIEY